MRVHIILTDRKEDGGGGHRQPKDHSLRTAEIGRVSRKKRTNIKWHLHTSKLFGRVAQRQPSLSTINKTKHLEFSKTHWNYDWKRALWSDEMKTVTFWPYTPSTCLVAKWNTYKEKHLIPPVKYGGGSLILFKWFAASSEAPFKMNGTMNSTKWQDILAEKVVASAWKQSLGQR